MTLAIKDEQLYQVSVERQKAAQAAGNYDLADLPGALAEPAAAARVGKIPKQDKVLKGGRSLTSVAKLALLPALLFVPGASGLLLAWMIPTVVAIVIVNSLTFSRLLEPGHATTVRPRELVRFSTQDLVGAMALVLSLRLVPIVTVETIDKATAARVGVPWTIVTVAVLALDAISKLVLVELARDPENADAVSHRMSRSVMMLFLPAALAGAALAYPVLSLAGRGYDDVGAPVLAVGSLALAPASLVECRFAVLRFRHQLRRVAVLQIVRAAALLGGVGTAIALGHPNWIGLALTMSNLVLVPVVWRTSSMLRAGRS